MVEVREQSGLFSGSNDSARDELVVTELHMTLYIDCI